VTEMFNRCASGKYSLMGLRDFLGEHEAKKYRYAIWHLPTNQVYLGMVPHRKNDRSPFKPKTELSWAQGKHQPLIDQDTFGQVQARLTEDKSRQRGRPAAKYLLSGLVVCGSCDHRYQAQTRKALERQNVY
jgi:hypothetical protein